MASRETDGGSAENDYSVGMFLSLGITFGFMLGLMLDNLGMGLSLGLAVGTFLNSIREKRARLKGSTAAMIISAAGTLAVLVIWIGFA